MKDIFFTFAPMGIALIVIIGLLYMLIHGIYSVLADWQLGRELNRIRKEARQRPVGERQGETQVAVDPLVAFDDEPGLPESQGIFTIPLGDWTPPPVTGSSTPTIDKDVADDVVEEASIAVESAREPATTTEAELDDRGEVEPSVAESNEPQQTSAVDESVEVAGLSTETESVVPHSSEAPTVKPESIDVEAEAVDVTTDQPDTVDPGDSSQEVLDVEDSSVNIDSDTSSNSSSYAEQDVAEPVVNEEPEQGQDPNAFLTTPVTEFDPYSVSGVTEIGTTPPSIETTPRSPTSEPSAAESQSDSTLAADETVGDPELAVSAGDSTSDESSEKEPVMGPPEGEHTNIESAKGGESRSISDETVEPIGEAPVANTEESEMPVELAAQPADESDRSGADWPTLSEAMEEHESKVIGDSEPTTSDVADEPADEPADDDAHSAKVDDLPWRLPAALVESTDDAEVPETEDEESDLSEDES